MSENDRLISVIVPVYNAERYLESCIGSILSQTYGNFELIVIDDGSTDSSLAICRNYRDRDKRVTVIHQENRGVSAARNAGLSRAKGEYFSFVDSDDTVERDMLEKLLTAAEDTSCDISICGYRHISGTAAEYFSFPYETISAEGDGIARFAADNYLKWLVRTPWGKLYRNIQPALRFFDENLSMGEDIAFNLIFFRNARKVTVIEDCLYSYREREGALTGSYRSGYFGNYCRVYEDSLSYFGSLGTPVDTSRVNMDLIVRSVHFICQFMAGGNGLKKTTAFISSVCNSSSVCRALSSLPDDMSSAARLYVYAIRHKRVFALYLICLLRSAVRRDRS